MKDLPKALLPYAEQIEHLIKYIEVKGLTFKTDEEFTLILEAWLRDGERFMHKVQRALKHDPNFINNRFAHLLD